MIVATLDVTFVIAAFNAEETLLRAIDSALAQRGVSVEVVVVDDCSTDSTRRIVEGHGDARVRLVALKRNLGPGGARNAGLGQALGEWVAILDSDDEVHPDRLSRMIERARRSSAAIVVDNIEVETEDGARETMFPEQMLIDRPLMTLADFIDSNRLFRSVYNFGYMKPIFRRAFLVEQRLQFDESLDIGEDYIFLASALAKGGSCVVEPKAGYVYHIRAGSISRVLKPHHVDAMMAADARFVHSHALDPEAHAAQKRRRRSLTQAQSFLAIVDHIKRRSPLGVIGVALRDPQSLRHLAMPIAARLRRLWPKTARSDNSAAPSGAAKRSSLGPGPHTTKG